MGLYTWAVDTRPLLEYATRFVHAGRHPRVRLALAAALFLFFSYHVTRFRLDAIWPLAPFGDASIFHDRSLEVLALADYPARLGKNHAHALFAYPPGAVMIFGALAAAGPAAFMAAWLVVMGAALVVSLRASLAQEPDHLRAAWLVVGAVALAVTAAGMRSQSAAVVPAAETAARPGPARTSHGRRRPL